MSSHNNKGKEHSQNVKKDIDNYCDFLQKQEKKKEKEIADLISDKQNSSNKSPDRSRSKR
jgi:hypothetical protein